MTCGLCSSKSFAEHYGVDGQKNKLYGYTSGATSQFLLERLYYVGARSVLWDHTLVPGQPVQKRPQYRLLLKLMRSGDSVLISHNEALGSRKINQQRAISELEDRGVQLFFLTPFDRFEFSMERNG